MAEQEKLNEFSGQLPKVSKTVIDKLIEDFKGNRELFVKGWDDMKKSDKNLFVALVTYFNDPENDLDNKYGRLGGCFTYVALKQLEQEGTSLPPVTEQVILTFIAEWKSADKPATATDFNFPIPFTYCEENPALMVFILMQENNSMNFARGAMMAYELKRRQFHADQLATKLGV